MLIFRNSVKMFAVALLLFTMSCTVFSQSVDSLKRQALDGDAVAQNNLAIAYSMGDGSVAPDYAQAVVWFRKAADQGNAGAQMNLGFAYHMGRGGDAGRCTGCRLVSQSR